MVFETLRNIYLLIMYYTIDINLMSKCFQKMSNRHIPMQKFHLHILYEFVLEYMFHLPLNRFNLFLPSCVGL